MNHMSLRILLSAGLFALFASACAPDAPDASPAGEQTATDEVEAAAAPEAPPPAAEPPRPAPVATAKPRPQPSPPQPVICADCGTVSAITETTQKGEGSGAGAVAGAVAGGVAGHQVGGGRGKDVATVAGAILGAMAGHEIEKRARSTTSYDISVTMDDGSQRLINVVEPGGLTVGTKVRVEGNTIYPR